MRHLTTALVWLVSIGCFIYCSEHEHEAETVMNSTGIVLDYLKDNPQDVPEEVVVNRNKLNPDKIWQKWAHALLNIINHPENPEYSKAILYRDEDIIVISDKFPKAKFHFLVLPASTRIDTAAHVTKKDIPIIEKMLERANKYLEELKSKSQRAAAANFKMGFHGKPSMKQLHLHVLSDDFNAPGMKHAKHYNTFTTRYFIDVHEFIDVIKREGYYPIDFSEMHDLSEGPTLCHRCGIDMGTNWTEAKRHYTSCAGKEPVEEKS